MMTISPGFSARDILDEKYLGHLREIIESTMVGSRTILRLHLSGLREK